MLLDFLIGCLKPLSGKWDEREIYSSFLLPWVGIWRDVTEQVTFELGLKEGTWISRHRKKKKHARKAKRSENVGRNWERWLDQWVWQESAGQGWRSTSGSWLVFPSVVLAKLPLSTSCWHLWGIWYHSQGLYWPQNFYWQLWVGGNLRTAMAASCSVVRF